VIHHPSSTGEKNINTAVAIANPGFCKLFGSACVRIARLPARCNQCSLRATARGYLLRGNIELTDVQSETQISGRTSDLSLFECH